MTIQLPLYIQKNIIKILCKLIDRNNRLMDVVGMDNTWYRKNEKEIKKLMINIALVSHDWFKTLSNNLSVAVDFNYKEYNDNWSIIKQNNVRVLKLHYSHKDNQVYTNLDGTLSEIPLVIVNEKIEKLTKSSSGLFKSLKLRNLHVKSTPTSNPLPFINSLYDCNWGSTNGGKDLHIYEIILNETTTIQDIKLYKDKVKRIFSITIDKCKNKQVILKSFELYHKKLIGLDQYDILSNQFSLCDILVVEGGHNYLSNITLFNITDPNLTIKECNLIFKSAHKLERFRVNICYKNLLYFLSTSKERLADSTIQRCPCDGIIERNGNSIEEQQEEFNYNWLQFKQLVNNHKTLIGLLFNFECATTGAFTRKIFPDSFVREIVSLVSPCKSLREFTFMSSITSQIFKELVKHNKTITYYEASSISGSCDLELIAKEFNQIIQENQHIQCFIFLKQTYNFEIMEYDVSTLLNYKKE